MPPAVPVVDVIVVTYNHARYLREALDSVVMQQTNFLWRALVADDCSTDGTQAIIQEYAEKYPNIIIPFLSPKNIGITPPVECHAWTIVRKNSTAKYLAYLEGDDYWTDPLKLQKQADLLDSDSGIALCFHDVTRVDADGNPLEAVPPWFPQRSAYDVADLLEFGCFIVTLSAMFRRDFLFLGNNRDWVRKARAGDWMLFLVLAEQGSLRRMDGVWGAYRIHAGGVFRGLNDRRQLEHNYAGYELCQARFTLPTYQALIKKNLSERSLYLASLCLRDNDLPAARRYLLLCARNYTRTASIPIGKYLFCFLRAFTPRVYTFGRAASWYWGRLRHPRELCKSVRAKFHCGSSTRGN